MTSIALASTDAALFAKQAQAIDACLDLYIPAGRPDHRHAVLMARDPDGVAPAREIFPDTVKVEASGDGRPAYDAPPGLWAQAAAKLTAMTRGTTFELGMPKDAVRFARPLQHNSGC